jgi:hypothetical protein
MLDLLAIRQGHQWEQGTAIWNPLLLGRRVFLLGDKPFGADGYCDGRCAVMLQNQVGTVFESRGLHFDRSALQPSESAAAKAAKGALQEKVQRDSQIESARKPLLLRHSGHQP